MHPEGLVGAVPVLVVLNRRQSGFQLAGVQCWVQGVSVGAERRECFGASILLFGKVLVELARSEVLVALGSFVFAGL